jgi:hypothetical protein
VFFVGAGLTALGVAGVIVSGVAAQNDPGKDAVLRDCVGQGESCPTFQRGKSAELRTNVILAGTGAVALATTIVGVFFTQWSKPAVAGRAGASTSPSLSPWASTTPHGGALGVTGTF